MISGGSDSMALLALVSDFAKIVPRVVIVHHCHHGVIAAADDWLSFVATEAQRRDFGFKAHRLALEMGPDFEARARKARYDSVMSDVQSGDVVMTAHHRDDQVETLLIRLSQGSGLIGLAGIPVMRPFGQGLLIRPLLSLSRKQLKQVLVSRNLQHITDPSNQDSAFLRNFRKALIKNKVNNNYVQFIESKDRKTVDFLLTKMGNYIDVIIPRGGKGLVKKVQELSKIPVIGHLEGICHTYIDDKADLSMSKKITLNAKLRNTAICGATETILIHQKILKKFCDPILSNLEKNGCKIIGDKKISKFYKGKITTAKESDWSTEYLGPIVSIKSVKNINEAINHINKYGTMHTDAIITKNVKSAKKFLKEVKSSISMHNTSTQFADGGEFGFGGEVGISTNTLPPRGPVGLDQLVSYKYQVTSNGKIRK